jgi:acetyl-CoA acetyltransferase
MGDFTATSAAASAAAAYKMAGMGPEDMEMAMIYDSFTVTAGITAEMLGLAPRGEGFTLWRDGHAAPGGRLPINTNGGGLSFNHSGMYGMQLLVEAYRQLSGTAEDGFSGIKGKQTKAKSCVVNGAVASRPPAPSCSSPTSYAIAFAATLNQQMRRTALRCASF